MKKNYLFLVAVLIAFATNANKVFAVDWTPLPYDATSVIVNPTVDAPDNISVPAGWTVTKGAAANYTLNNEHYSGAVNRYFDSYLAPQGALAYTAEQTITGVPNGHYMLTSAARADGLGAYVYAKTSGKTYRTEIIVNGNSGGALTRGFNYIKVEAIVTDGTLTIGVTSDQTVSGGSAWNGYFLSADDFTLTYYGTIAVIPSTTNLSFDVMSNKTKTFSLSGANLTEDVTLTAPAGITLSKTTVTPAEVHAGVTITAEFTGTASIVGGAITMVTGAVSRAITVNAVFEDISCFPLAYTDRANLIRDPFCNDRSKFGGWGDVAVSSTKSFCGANSMKIFGGSLDVSIAGGIPIASNKVYRFRAKIFTPTDHTSRFGLFGIGYSGDIVIYSPTTKDTWETVDFTFKTGNVSAGGIFIQRTSGTDGVFVDNVELYEVAEPTVRVKYVDADDVNISVKTERTFTPTWGKVMANYLTIGKTFAAVATDKDDIVFNSSVYKYEATSVDNTTIVEGENIITLKFKKVNEPSVLLSKTSLFFDAIHPTSIFHVSGTNLVQDLALTPPTGISLSKTTLTPAEVHAGVDVTAEFVGAATILTGAITMTTGAVTKNISVIASYDAGCFSPVPGAVNLIPNPYMNSLDQFGGWGRKSVVFGAEAYCGAACVKFDAINHSWPDGGAALDLDVAWKPNTNYRLRAMVKAMDGTFAFFCKGTGPNLPFSVPQSNDEWVLIDHSFTSGAAAGAGIITFNNVDGASTGLNGYIDNYELFEDLGTGVSAIKTNSKLNAGIENGRVFVNFEAEVGGVVQLNIFNVQGVELATVKSNAVKGQNQYMFNAELPSGVYVIRMSENNKYSTVKIVK